MRVGYCIVVEVGCHGVQGRGKIRVGYCILVEMGCHVVCRVEGR